MAINTFTPNDPTPLAGLGTFTSNVTVAGPYTCSVQSTIPLGSGLQIVVNQNGTAMLTVGGSSTNPSATQASIGSSVNLYCAVNDVITVVLSSSNAVDSAPNAVKTLINFYQYS